MGSVHWSQHFIDHRSTDSCYWSWEALYLDFLPHWYPHQNHASLRLHRVHREHAQPKTMKRSTVLLRDCPRSEFLGFDGQIFYLPQRRPVFLVLRANDFKISRAISGEFQPVSNPRQYARLIPTIPNQCRKLKLTVSPNTEWREHFLRRSDTDTWLNGRIASSPVVSDQSRGMDCDAMVTR